MEHEHDSFEAMVDLVPSAQSATRFVFDYAATNTPNDIRRW